jgi:hypothetical protein
MPDYDQLARDLRKPLAPYFLSLQSGYEQGTFTPQYEGLTTPGSWTYSVQTGFYTRIGHRCFFQLSLTSGSRPVAPTGAALISQLPFTSAADANSHSPVVLDTIDAVTLTGTTMMLTARIPPNKTYIEFIEVLGTAPTAAGQMLATGFGTASTVRVSGNYIVG